MAIPLSSLDVLSWQVFLEREFSFLAFVVGWIRTEQPYNRCWNLTFLTSGELHFDIPLRISKGKGQIFHSN